MDQTCAGGSYFLSSGLFFFFSSLYSCRVGFPRYYSKSLELSLRFQVVFTVQQLHKCHACFFPPFEKGTPSDIGIYFLSAHNSLFCLFPLVYFTQFEIHRLPVYLTRSSFVSRSLKWRGNFGPYFWELNSKNYYILWCVTNDMK